MEGGGGQPFSHRQSHHQTHIPGVRQAQTTTKQKSKQQQSKKKQKKANNSKAKKSKREQNKNANLLGQGMGIMSELNDGRGGATIRRQSATPAGTHSRSQAATDNNKARKRKKEQSKKKQKGGKQKHQNILGRGWGITSELFEVGKGKHIYLELLAIIVFQAQPCLATHSHQMMCWHFKGFGASDWSPVTKTLLIGHLSPKHTSNTCYWCVFPANQIQHIF